MTLKSSENFFHFSEYHVQTIKAKDINIKIQGNSGTAMPTYHVLWLGTGRKLTRERIKRIIIRIIRIKVIVFTYLRIKISKRLQRL